MKKALVRVITWGLAALIMLALINISWWWLLAAPLLIVIAIAVMSFGEVAVDAPMVFRQVAKNRSAHYEALADAQNEQYMSGDERGIYGDFPPAKLN
ncbi:UNVERIFIED_ORG: fatty acid desaturase [Rhodococcus erythropolis]